MLIKRLATAATAVAATATQETDAEIESLADTYSLCISITGGSARTVQAQASPDGTNWFNIGTSRTTAANFFESVNAMPFFRINITANTGSTVDAWLVVPG